ncbi:MAG: exo-alpha-sialidase [Verrucomicrobia bacterium]|nr:exo-alpha-sialidase [Verrucomicrobiota bacterium]
MTSKLVFNSLASRSVLLAAALVLLSLLNTEHCLLNTSAAVAASHESELRFTPDPGLRIDNASNPAARVDESGKVILFYENQASHRVQVATAADGMKFSEGVPPTGIRHPFDTKLPDGTWRRYSWDRRTRTFTSSSSKDGSRYTPDAGVRYSPHESDRGTMGIYDVFSDARGGVVLLYLGDMQGANNTRRAYSTDGGNTFAFTDGNVLGDARAGGGARTYVDQHSIPLPGGQRRLTCMKACDVYSFVTEDDGKTFKLEPGTRLACRDFTEFPVRCLNDPTLVRLPDGRFRIYVTAQTENETGRRRQAIVSATTAAP